MTLQHWHKIISMEVAGGFLDGQVVSFSPHLNCLIGGRGSGKTSVIELLRFALVPEDSAALRKCRQDVAGILGNGRVTVVLENAAGDRYMVQRSVNGRPRVINSQGQTTTIDPNQVGGVEVAIFGQSQLERVADNPDEQLSIIDAKNSLIPFVKRDIDQHQELLREKRTELGKVLKDIKELSARVSDLPDIKERLQALAGEDLDGLLQRKRQREKEKFYLAELARIIHNHEQREKRNTLSKGFLPQDEIEQLPNCDLLEEAISSWVDTCGQVAEINSKAAGLWAAALNQVEAVGKTLADRHQREELEDEKIETNLPVKGLDGALKERTQLTARLLELEKLVDLLSLREREVERLQAQRQEIKQQQADCREKLYQLRANVCREFNVALAPEIQVSIVPGGNLQAYRNLLNEGLINSTLHYKQLVKQVVDKVSPAEMSSIIRDLDYVYLAQCTGMDIEKARRLAFHLAGNTTPEELLLLEDLWLEDLPQINLQDGEMKKNINHLSKGQKCTTILPLLLLEDQRPLIIDQPEDHLDNAYITGSVVPTIKKVKQNRQLIFATHNPNIPVLGEAEQDLVLMADGTRGWVACQGDLNNGEVNEALQRLLEGGSDALRGRLLKYGG